MMKKLCTFLIALCATSSMQPDNVEVIRSSLFPNVLHTKEVKFSKDKPNCAIFWDLNSVVFTKDTSPRNIARMIRALMKEKGVRYTLRALAKFGKLWRKKKKLKKAGDNRGFVWDAMFTEMEKTDPELAKFLRRFSQMANNLEGFMADLLFDLKNAGHHNAVLSNMGQGLLDVQVDLIKKQKQTPAVRYVLEFLQDNVHKTIASKDNGWMHKPNADIYEIALKRNKDVIKKDTIKIFIDDKECNCVAAVKNGFDVAIICDNQHDIKPILKALGVKGL